MAHVHEKIDFTVDTFIVFNNKVLLRHHDKYDMWLPVGGHIELGEDPNEAAVREVKEEVVAGQKGIFSAAALVKAAVAITVRVIRRHIQKRDHGFYPSIIEEILREFYIADFGSWLWGQMKQKAEGDEAAIPAAEAAT